MILSEKNLKHLKWGCFGLSALVLILVAYLTIRFREQAVLGLFDLMLTFAIGLLGNVLGAGLVTLAFSDNEMPQLTKLMTTVAGMDSEIGKVATTCEVLYQRGIWVANKRALLKTAFYEQHFATASKIDVLGIANTAFMASLYPGYAEKPFELSTVSRSQLFDRLRTEGLVVTVLFLDPDCDFAKTRNGEPGNGRTVQDLREVVAAIKKIQQAYDRATTKDDWRLKGALTFMMFPEDPHNSIFKTRRDPPEMSAIVVGLLPRNMFGEEGPSLIVHRSNDHMDLYDSYSYQLEEIKRRSKPLLMWDHHGVQLF